MREKDAKRLKTNDPVVITNRRSPHFGKTVYFRGLEMMRVHPITPRGSATFVYSIKSHEKPPRRERSLLMMVYVVDKGIIHARTQDVWPLGSGEASIVTVMLALFVANS